MRYFYTSLLLFFVASDAIAQDRYPTVAEVRTGLTKILNAYKSQKLNPASAAAMKLMPADSVVIYGSGKDVSYANYLHRRMKRADAHEAFAKWQQLFSAALSGFETNINPLVRADRFDYFTKFYVSKGSDSTYITLGTSDNWNVYFRIRKISSWEAEAIANARKIVKDETNFVRYSASGKPEVIGQLIDDDGLPARDQQQGSGRIALSNGDWFQGHIKDGKFDYGDFHYSNGEVYNGNYKDNIPTGLGTLVKADGSEYLGFFNNGVLDMRSAGFRKHHEDKYAPVSPASSSSSSSSYSNSSSSSGSSSGSTGTLSPEQQKVIDDYNANTDPDARRRKIALEKHAEIDRRIERDRNRINGDYRTQYNNAQQRSQEETQRRIDSRNAELDRQERLQKEQRRP